MITYIVKNVKQELYYDRREGIIYSDRSQPLKWGSVKRLWAINILPVINRSLNKLGLEGKKRFCSDLIDEPTATTFVSKMSSEHQIYKPGH